MPLRAHVRPKCKPYQSRPPPLAPNQFDYYTIEAFIAVTARLPPNRGRDNVCSAYGDGPKTPERHLVGTNEHLQYHCPATNLAKMASFLTWDRTTCTPIIQSITYAQIQWTNAEAAIRCKGQCVDTLDCVCPFMSACLEACLYARAPTKHNVMH